MTVTTYSATEASERCGVPAETLRYYERIGLLSTARTPGNHRRFDADDLGWIEVLRCLRLTGMPIRDMVRFAELVRAERGGRDIAQERVELLRAQETAVVRQLDELATALALVRRKIDYYANLQEED